MILFLLLIFCILILWSVRFSPLETLSPLSQQAHQICLNLVPEKTSHYAEIAALVCGENFSSLNQSSLYVASGLIHLFVVSGAHLLLIESFLTKIIEDKKVIFLILLFYGFLCGLNPPILRSLCFLALQNYLASKNINWPSHFRLFIAGLCCLLLDFSLIKSLSLQLSWLAAFAVIQTQKITDSLTKHTLFYFLLLPVLITLQTPNLLHIFSNLLLAPILEFILFPLALSTMFFNFLTPLFDWSIDSFRMILIFFELDRVQFSNLNLEKSKILIWCYLFLLQLLAHVIYVKNRRAKK